MNVKDFESAIDILADKFGMVIDWTSDNVIPYVKDILERVIQYKIVTNSIGLGISLLVLISCILYFVFMHREYKKLNSLSYDDRCILSKEDRLHGGFFYKYNYFNPHNVCLKDDSEYWSLVVVYMIVISVGALIGFSVSLLEWSYIPEFKIVHYLTNMKT